METATVPEPGLAQNIQDPRVVTRLLLAREGVHMVEVLAENRMAQAASVLQPDDLPGRGRPDKSVGDHRAVDLTTLHPAAVVTDSESKVCRKYKF